VAADPSDDRILECAVAADAEVIVSGDQHLLALGALQGNTDSTLGRVPRSLSGTVTSWIVRRYPLRPASDATLTALVAYARRPTAADLYSEMHTP
jgi:hypothetical protein